MCFGGGDLDSMERGGLQRGLATRNPDPSKRSGFGCQVRPLSHWGYIMINQSSLVKTQRSRHGDAESREFANEYTCPRHQHVTLTRSLQQTPTGFNGSSVGARSRGPFLLGRVSECAKPSRSVLTPGHFFALIVTHF